MKTTYVVAYLSLHNGELFQQVFEAETPFDAMYKFLDDGRGGYEHCQNEEDIYETVCNQDAYISVIQV